MLRKFKGISPDVDPKAHVFESADVIGMVKMKEFASVWPNCTGRGDVNRIEIGRYSNIQDNSCLHVADRYACIVGDTPAPLKTMCSSVWGRWYWTVA